MEEQGAEAVVEIRDSEVVKDRKTKNYRHEKLDKRLREDRTAEEARRMKKAKKYGVNTPEILKEEDTKLEIEKVDGNQLKKHINNSKVLESLGENVAILHNQNIIHGDLTTSNIIVKEDTDEAFLIDFGLSNHSSRVEDKAVDLNVFKQVLRTSHPYKFEEAWGEFKESYVKNQKESEEVLERLEEVEDRGRYK